MAICKLFTKWGIQETDVDVFPVEITLINYSYNVTIK